MDEKQYRNQLRRRFSGIGWTLLIYYGILNVSVILVLVTDMVIHLLENPHMMFSDTVDQYWTDAVMGNAWGYLLAIAIGLLLLLIWKGRKFCFREIWVTEKSMTTKDFFGLLCVFVSGQLILQIEATILEVLLNLFGLSAIQAIERVSGVTDTFNMFLYMCIFAPIAEEILFRGLILRTLQPYGRKFAIFTSAFLFGIFHGNLVQSPFAFVVGLVLGYTAMEYSILWAMVLHMFNNLLLSDVLSRLVSGLPENVAIIVSSAVIVALSVAGIIVAIVNHKKIAAYLDREKMNRTCLKCFFSGAGIIVFMVLMLANMVLGITAYTT